MPYHYAVLVKEDAERLHYAVTRDMVEHARDYIASIRSVLDRLENSLEQ